MFDDPKKELQRLEEQLLAQENADDDFERFYSEIYAEFGPGEAQPADDIPIRNHANGYGRNTHQPVASYRDNAQRRAPVKKDKSIRTLSIIAIAETLGIVAIVLWWVLRIL